MKARRVIRWAVAVVAVFVLYDLYTLGKQRIRAARVA